MVAFIHALILALVFEGVMFSLFPGVMRKAMLEAASHSDQGLRAMGGMALALALFIFFAMRLFN